MLTKEKPESKQGQLVGSSKGVLVTNDGFDLKKATRSWPLAPNAAAAPAPSAVGFCPRWPPAGWDARNTLGGSTVFVFFGQRPKANDGFTSSPPFGPQWFLMRTFCGCHMMARGALTWIFARSSASEACVSCKWQSDHKPNVMCMLLANV